VSTRTPREPRPQPVAIQDLVEDPAIYIRRRTDEHHINEIAEAMRAGATMPPVVVETGTLRLVDGWHRVPATRKVSGDGATINAVFRTYASDKDLVLDAMRENAGHGRKLDTVDKVRSLALAEQLGADDASIASALRVTIEKLGTLRLRIATRVSFAGIVQPGADLSDEGEPMPSAVIRVPLKYSVVHLSGKELTEEQEDAIKLAPGVSYRLLVRQLRSALTTGLLDPDDERLLTQLRALQGDLRRYLASRPAPAPIS
jgi:hypothetical protein